ncbi:uncharacterized protein CIMG_13266 [Coccidioides immitis RS]|uniref:Uncharacterized protein n=1 Tax=Coccidioides immitis (strain RS) TaxID=246410 RepID=A0A0D8JU66_COCIM|nr:uncharacterized protein CIMG_13266 [Coccidioides immitis RS]KJF60832.1 hypothetical protein CIMG_13266 [Coccidioides immitis RS]
MDIQSQPAESFSSQTPEHSVLVYFLKDSSGASELNESRVCIRHFNYQMKKGAKQRISRLAGSRLTLEELVKLRLRCPILSSPLQKWTSADMFEIPVIYSFLM